MVRSKLIIGIEPAAAVLIEPVATCFKLGIEPVAICFKLGVEALYNTFPPITVSTVCSSAACTSTIPVHFRCAHVCLFQLCTYSLTIVL